ncbi:MAG: class I SAM-dependent methyltransferase [Cyclobacteriaceae bacterium]|nr:class I SAM-dependent methyltransferase [Cyclobacteriaceae bacterium]
MQKASIKELNHLLGNIDIYLLDQILKGRFQKHFKILDAGCGDGRNLIYFVRNGYKVYGIDKDEDSIQMLKHLIKSINKDYPLDRFTVGKVGDMPFANHEFDAIISSAVLHFAEDNDHFINMFSELDRVLKPEGILFVRMATDVGMKDKIKSMGNGKFYLPDGSVRFLLTKEILKKIMDQFGFDFIEPFKSVIVDDERCMSTLMLKKV